MAKPQESRSFDKVAGVHADFASGLGRRARTLAAWLDAGEWDEARKVAALIRSGARSLRLDALAAETEDLLADLEDGGDRGAIHPDTEAWRARLAEWPGLAWLRGPTVPPAALVSDTPVGADVLLWGSEALADVVRARGVYEARAICNDVRATEDDWATARVCIIDSDVEGAEAFFENVSARNMPAVVLVSDGKDVAVWRARGAALVHPKPVSPGVIRRSVATWLREATPRATDFAGGWALGNIANRIADTLCEALMPASDDDRSRTADFGDGAEISSVLERATRELRALVELRAGGPVNFVARPPFAETKLVSWPDTAEIPTPASARVLAGMRVVLAEDDPGTRWHFAELLRAQGCEVTEAANGVEAWAALEETPADLVITDILMPVLGGFELRERIVGDTYLSTTPVLLLSWQDDWLEAALERGVNPRWLLRKDAATEDFLACAATAVGSRAGLERHIGTRGLPMRARLEELSLYAYGEALADSSVDAELVLRGTHVRTAIGFHDGRVVYARAWSGDVFETGIAALRMAFALRRGDVELRDTKDDAHSPELNLRWNEVPTALRRTVQQQTPDAPLAAPKSVAGHTLWELSSLAVRADFIPREGRALPPPGSLLRPELSNTPMDHVKTYVDRTLYGPAPGRVHSDE